MKFSSYYILLFCLVAQPFKGLAQLSKSEQNEVLLIHNKARAEVGKSPLIWSDSLADYAQQWANYLAKDCSFKHRPNSGKWAQQYGENIYGGSDNRYTVDSACYAWLNEKQYYHDESIDPNTFHAFGHYIQMIWGATTEIGMAKAICKDGSVIFVANYSPRGNMVGAKP